MVSEKDGRRSQTNRGFLKPGWILCCDTGTKTVRQLHGAVLVRITLCQEVKHGAERFPARHAHSCLC